jgi:hypothetical protein
VNQGKIDAQACGPAARVRRSPQQDDFGKVKKNNVWVVLRKGD